MEGGLENTHRHALETCHHHYNLCAPCPLAPPPSSRCLQQDHSPVTGGDAQNSTLLAVVVCTRRQAVHHRESMASVTQAQLRVGLQGSDNGNYDHHYRTVRSHQQCMGCVQLSSLSSPHPTLPYHTLLHPPVATTISCVWAVCNSPLSPHPSHPALPHLVPPTLPHLQVTVIYSTQQSQPPHPPPPLTSVKYSMNPLRYA